MMRAMLAVLRPGRLETEVAAWGAWVGRMLGSEADGFKIMVGANEANRTLIGPALNRPIREGDWVHLGVAPQRDGLTACVRRSVIAVDDPSRVTEDRSSGWTWSNRDIESAKRGIARWRPRACRRAFKSRRSWTTSRDAPKRFRRGLESESIWPRSSPTPAPTTPAIPSARSFSALSRWTAMSPSAAGLSPCWTWPCAESAITGMM